MKIRRAEYFHQKPVKYVGGYGTITTICWLWMAVDLQRTPTEKEVSG